MASAETRLKKNTNYVMVGSTRSRNSTRILKWNFLLKQILVIITDGSEKVNNHVDCSDFGAFLCLDHCIGHPHMPNIVCCGQ